MARGCNSLVLGMLGSQIKGLWPVGKGGVRTLPGSESQDEDGRSAGHVPEAMQTGIHTKPLVRAAGIRSCLPPASVPLCRTVCQEISGISQLWGHKTSPSLRAVAPQKPT